jgi:hypothetical protein
MGVRIRFSCEAQLIISPHLVHHSVASASRETLAWTSKAGWVDDSSGLVSGHQLINIHSIQP